MAVNELKTGPRCGLKHDAEKLMAELNQLYLSIGLLFAARIDAGILSGLPVGQAALSHGSYPRGPGQCGGQEQEFIFVSGAGRGK